MSEHDEPKTALTRLVLKHGRAHPVAEIGGFKIRCTCGLILREVEDGMLTVPLGDEDRAAHAAHLADVLLAEGYTTSPAPEATELRNLRRWKAEATLLFDGMQDLGRALGLPLGTLVTGPEAVKAAEALKARADAAPEATETVEWGVRDALGAIWSGGDSMWPKADAIRAATEEGDVLIARVHRVTEWVPVDRAADEHEEGGPPDD